MLLEASVVYSRGGGGEKGGEVRLLEGGLV